MLFNSLEFLIFLVLVFAAYWFIFQKNYKLQNLFIVAVSYIFYGWWSWQPLCLIALTSLLSYLSGILIAGAQTKHSNKANQSGINYAKLILITNVVINLFILGLFKYYNFFADSFTMLMQGFGIQVNWVTINLVLPVGVSFYTFQALSYSIDVYYRKLEPTKDVVAFFAFVSFFPQLVAGPIERATNLLPQFLQPRQFDYTKAVDGLRQILWGFFKKVVIADTCATTVNKIFADWSTLPGSSLWIAAFLFTIQIYCDFSGYSDIAIGTARLFGISLRRNFNFPYFSRDIAEFWRRWHISLSTWFRDYVYIPLGGSRGSKLLVLRNTFIIFALSGLWHGANWTFVVWGLYHAMLFIPLMLLNQNRKNTNTVAEGRLLPTLKEAGQMLLCFILVLIGLVIFRAETISDAWGYICRMFGATVFEMPEKVFTLRIVTVYPLILLMLFIEWIQRQEQHPLQFNRAFRLTIVNTSHAVRYGIYLSILFIISLYMYGVPSTFIYFQF